MLDNRAVVMSITCDTGLNPTDYAIYLYDGTEIVRSEYDDFGAFHDLGDAVKFLRHQAACMLIHQEWWR